MHIVTLNKRQALLCELTDICMHVSRHHAHMGTRTHTCALTPRLPLQLWLFTWACVWLISAPAAVYFPFSLAKCLKLNLLAYGAATATVCECVHTGTHTHSGGNENKRGRRSRINGKTKSFNFIFSKGPETISRIFPTQRGAAWNTLWRMLRVLWGGGGGGRVGKGLKGAGCAFALQQKKKIFYEAQ